MIFSNSYSNQLILIFFTLLCHWMLLRCGRFSAWLLYLCTPQLIKMETCQLERCAKGLFPTQRLLFVEWLLREGGSSDVVAAVDGSCRLNKEARKKLNFMELFQFSKNKLNITENLTYAQASLRINQQNSCLSLSREYCSSGSWCSVRDNDQKN